MSMPVIISSNIERCQSITDVIESVALEETGLSHILNAEGEKIQKALELSKDNADLLKVNASVESMVKAITILESVLQDKLHLAELYPEPCPVVPCVLPEVKVVLADTATGTLVLTQPNLYTFTGLKTPAKLTISSVPNAPITLTKALPAGVTFVNNEILIGATYDWSIGHALGFAIGEKKCIVDLTISIKAVI
ncbi:MAG: hypothetical protein RSH78_04550 [Bacilli bacterium]